MKGSNKKSREDKIKENKPKRQEKSEQDKEFLNDLKLLIRLRDDRQMADSAIHRLKNKIQCLKNQLARGEDEIVLGKAAAAMDMLRIILKQRGVQVQWFQDQRYISSLWGHFGIGIQLTGRDNFVPRVYSESVFPNEEIHAVIQRMNDALHWKNDQVWSDQQDSNENQ